MSLSGLILIEFMILFYTGMLLIVLINYIIPKYIKLYQFNRDIKAIRRTYLGKGKGNL